MKKKCSFFVIAVLLLSVFSCTDVEVLPEDGTVASETFKTAEDYRGYLAKAYASYSHTGQDGPAGDPDITIVNDEGFTSYIRVYWKAQELTTDEAVVAWTDAGIRDLHNHNWTSENQFVRVLYYRIALIVSICNDFINQSSESNMDDYGIPAADRELVRTYRAEARYLRALAYWHALDLFQNIPLVTEITADLPQQSSPEALFNFIESELLELEDLMVDARQNVYGRADKGALWMLQAKLYLNSEVYTGQARYTECIEACQKVMNAGYELNEVYQHLFYADNHLSNEIIFPLIADGTNAQNWGNTTFLVNAAIGGEMESSDYGTGEAWAGLRTTSALVEKFPDVTGDTDGRAIFFTTGQSLEIDDIGEFSEGYAVPKYQNLNQDGTSGSNITHADIDYPMFRLADAYLMYAEAVLRGGTGGSRGEAVALINELRERAYGNTDGNISDADLTLDFILDERARELYWEATRRVDLIRYGIYTGGEYLWPWKGGVKQGRATEEFRDIFPIPAADLIANPTLTQNEGY